jgi:hypothetical protein
MFLSMVKLHCAEHRRFMQQAIDRTPKRIRATQFCMGKPGPSVAPVYQAD